MLKMLSYIKDIAICRKIR